MELIRLRGSEARPFIDSIAALRLSVFHDFPYLYEGNIEYERKYLETYFKSNDSFILLVRDENKFVGATTAILLKEEEGSFKTPFITANLDPSKICYFGESILLPQYRGQGLGKIFFQEREIFARTFPEVTTAAFCAVIREENHPMRPNNYSPLDEFWISQGFHKAKNLITEYDWLDVGDTESSKKRMQFWLKSLSGESNEY